MTDIQKEDQKEFFIALTRKLRDAIGGMYGEYLNDLTKELLETARRHRREFDKADALADAIIAQEKEYGRRVS
jgi:hypothetical protein